MTASTHAYSTHPPRARAGAAKAQPSSSRAATLPETGWQRPEDADTPWSTRGDARGALQRRRRCRSKRGGLVPSRRGRAARFVLAFAPSRSSALLLAVALCLSACARQSTPERPTILWFGGDVHFGEKGEAALEGLALDGPLVVNLEGPISPQPRPSSARALFNPPDSAVRLKSANVVAAGIENNHAMDDGVAGLERTRAALQANGLATLGSAFVAGVSILQIDLSSGVPVDLAKRLGVIKPTIVLFHVLAPPLYLPEPSLRRAVDLAVSSGAQAVIAHGSHAIGAVERRGATVIAWGLGNLAFDCDCTLEDEGLLVRLEVQERTVTRATAVPVRAGLHGEHARLLDDATTDLSLLESLGSALTHKTSTRADW